MIYKIDRHIAGTAQPSPNVVQIVRGIGQSVSLVLPGGRGKLELTVDEVRGDRVGLVLAVTQPHVIVMGMSDGYACTPREIPPTINPMANRTRLCLGE